MTEQASASTISYPGETKEYRKARNELLQAEMELRAKVEEVAALRRRLPPGGEVNYTFAGVDGPVKMADLFENGKTTLILYSFMFGADDKNPCPMCSGFLDSTNGIVKHILQRADFAVVARSGIDRFADLAAARGWDQVRLLSAADNTYARDFHTETADGRQLPMCNVFVKEADKVRHFWSSEMFFAPSEWHPRHIDMAYPLWNILDLTPEGRGDFFPSLTY